MIRGNNSPEYFITTRKLSLNSYGTDLFRDFEKSQDV